MDSHARDAHGPAAGLPSAARRPRRSDAGVPADRRPGRRRVAGYEALARFPGSAGPDVWFAAAAEAGSRAELEALAIRKALAAVPDLPPDTFLTVNVSPHLLGSAPVQAALAGRPDLHRVVVELTEHTPVARPRRAAPAVRRAARRAVP